MLWQALVNWHRHFRLHTLLGGTEQGKRSPH
jgi:hypothetical protein